MSIKSIIKKWIGVQEDIHHVEEQTRKEVTERLSAEKDAAVQKVAAERDSMLKNLADQHKADIDRLEAQLNEAKETIKRMTEQSTVKAQEAEQERKHLNEQLIAEKEASVKRLETVGSDINNAREDERKKVIERLSAEREAAVQKIAAEKDAAIALLQEKMKKEEELWKTERKQFSDLEQQLSKYREAGEKMKVIKKAGRGRPSKDRERFEINLDRGLKETIKILEKSGLIKHGAVSNHINEDMWEWLRPMREVLDQNMLRFEDADCEDEGIRSDQPDVRSVNSPVIEKPATVDKQTLKEDAIDAMVSDSPSPVTSKLLPEGLTPDQQVALSAMESGEDVFITGGAGTGKSYVVEQFVKRHSNVLLAAPTGLAARHIGGRTLHSLFKCDTGVLTPAHNLNNPQAFIDEIGPRNYKLLKAASTLIIDEISMVRQDMFDYIMTFMEAFQKAHHHIQIIVVGDFFQLAPVVSDDLREIWRGFYPDNSAGYSFKSPSWKFRMVQLREIVRQSDKAFADALNLIRIGDQRGIDWINENYCKDVLEKGVTLCPTKKEVEKINREHLHAIEGRSTIFKTEVKAEDNVWLKNIKKDMRVDDTLEVKPNVRVMILVNDKENASEPRYHNGSMGMVESISENSITVKLDNGSSVALEKNTWVTTIPEVVERKDEKGNKKKVIMQKEVGSYTQFPVKLAWAATIHKSQGQTYEETNINGNNVFGTGQIYVALSRATSIDKLHLQEPLKADTVQVSEEVKNFYGVD